MFNGHFVVVDTETTGLFPGKHDRIAEIAVVTLDRSGEVVDRWETLVNPQRDLGKQSIHGISARDILSAPTFEDIVDELEWRLSGNVIVAHNLSFDARFLDAEFHRAGTPLPQYYLNSGMCTMRMVHRYLEGGGRSLQDCCDAFDITLDHAHTAGSDALAAATLLSRYLELDPDLPEWDAALSGAVSGSWRLSEPREIINPVLRSEFSGSRPQHFLDRIVNRLPEFKGPAEHENYLAVLDLALVDRVLSAHEEQQLVSVANDLGIGQEEAKALHHRYFQDLVQACWQDGVLTEDETSDLYQVANLLQIDLTTVHAALIKPKNTVVSSAQSAESPSTTTASHSGRFSLEPGTLVVLTGEMREPRDFIETKLRDAGYVPHSGVTKKVGLLVAADPDSLSGKAKKARDYGIPVVSEDYLWNQVLSR
ncbi:DNA polymerase-3 subunit epsilon [Neomicrococcus aestuarii]|uniref:DNA polymerase-3 subunit epsilon n=1 Tax=Neomicrococcus aestuarii TaxID=556325 RepID=A0A7W8TVQ6_9MICC|nr:exonuclease domain-containing protein [Neomicrococcus aestuarii]MBB5512893.1 DNA polymerase-3 subunit epsilon [Neomicrococcus aestuarii]